jgi:hypothetical protein
MKKYITPDITAQYYTPHLQQRFWEPVKDEFVLTHHPCQYNDGWALSWAFPKRGFRNAVTETGFFDGASHIDRIGLYLDSSINYRANQKEIKEFKAPRSAQEIVQESGWKSKYDQVEIPVRWEGVVLAAQVPFDRSVRAVSTTDEYYDFVRAACKYYGRHLFLKLHPKQDPGSQHKMMDLAREHNCKCSHADMSVLDHCKFLLVHCSTMAMDAFIRGVPVVQYAAGYWTETGAVLYTDGEFADAPGETVEMGHKVADWCMWRYCFSHRQPIERWWDMLRLYAESEELCPLTEEFCYATNTHWRLD